MLLSFILMVAALCLNTVEMVFFFSFGTAWDVTEAVLLIIVLLSAVAYHDFRNKSRA